MMIDMHCHVDLYPEPEIFASTIAESGMYVLAVTTTPKAWTKTQSLLARFKRIRPALGLHPQLAHERFQELSLFESFISQTRYVGEVGLDGSPEFKSHAEVQLKVFRRIVFICQSTGGRILSIHSRGAATAVLDCIEERPGLGLPILHWFSGSQGELRRAIELGCWFSVGPAMLGSEKGRGIIRQLPRDRTLTETDGPFGKVRGKSLTPMEVSLAVEGLASIWSEPVKEVTERVYANFKRLVHTGCGEGVVGHDTV